ncbi:hypothetical protein [Hoylesella shahii]|uniref:hypothetical protein n=1 Tax=Hoylesella shahii TaxID=228603 RepID=UPI0023A85F10|nr:hypothetical protein [Hoylesella shahii]
MLVAALLIGWGSLPLSAQNATVSPQLGNLLAAYTHQSNEFGFEGGYGSYWQHNQLPITVTCSDFPTLSKDGVLRNHTGNFLYYKPVGSKTDKEKFLFVTCTAPTYLSIAMPKGYNITSYKIVIHDGLTPQDTVALNPRMPKLPFARAINWKFGEVDKSHIRENKEEKGQYIDPVFRRNEYVEINKDTPGLRYTIHREGNLGNILYFCFSGNRRWWKSAGVYLELVELTFSAGNTFEYPLTPTIEHENFVSLSSNNITLGRTDVGNLKLRTKNKATLYSYDQWDVREMTADIRLFEEGATDGLTWDATKGRKTIKCVLSNDSKGNEWYALRAGTYYVESPTTANIQGESGNVQMPVGYRIVEAKFDYKKGSYRKPGFMLHRGRVYLGKDLKGVAEGDAAIWHRTPGDEVYTIVDGKPQYLVLEKRRQQNNTFLAELSEKNKAVKLLKEGTTYYFWKSNPQGGEKFFLCAKQGETAYFQHNGGERLYETAPKGQEESTPFNIITYSADGKQGTTHVIGNRTKNSSIMLSGLNNDAVKFKIEGNGEAADPTALLRITLYMEPLNPYIKSVDAVCEHEGIELSRTFEAKNFTLGGDAFVYKVPRGSSTSVSLPFRFRNLTSEFADNTYGKLSKGGHSRYHFVGSNYYNAVADSLYAHADLVASSNNYQDKIEVNVAGNIPFPFNNAAELSNKVKRPESAYLSEKNFTIDNYKSVFIKDERGNKIYGNYSADNLTLKANETKTMYLYTSDETRYNIAPTQGEQHRAFAYYFTTITLKFQDYDPVVEWIPVYKTPMYYKNDKESHYTPGIMYGAVIKTTKKDDDGNMHQEGATSEFGYLTVDQILGAMNKSIAEKHGVGAPKSLKDVLYVDNTKLFNILPANAKEDRVHKLDSMRMLLASNAIIYLPVTAEALASVQHTALKLKENKGFEGRTNFELTDKEPFFAPYSIQLKDDCYASYTRKATSRNKGRVDYATLVLPFGLSVDNHGVHTNTVGTPCKFRLGKITDRSFKYDGNSKNKANHEGADYGATGKLAFLGKDGMSNANSPYIINIDKAYGDGNVSFVATQPGALIEKTPVAFEGMVSQDAAKCWIKGSEHKIKSSYTYAGHVLERSINPEIFYFSLNRFVAFANLSSSKLYLFPFRFVYYSEAGNGLHAKGFNSFGLTFDDDDNLTPTDIQDVQEEIVLKVTVGAGLITAEARKDAPLSVFNLSGQCVTRTMIKAGETRTIHLAPGVYVVNGKKMIVN